MAVLTQRVDRLMDEQELNSLLTDAIGGERGATAQILVHFGPRLSRRIESKMSQIRFPEFTSDDVLQEVYVDVFKGIGSFDPQRGVPLVAWLNRIADNRFNQTMRDRSRKKRGGHVWRVDGDRSSVIRLINDMGDDDQETPSMAVSGKEAAQAVEMCVASLPENQRDAINSYYLEEKNLDQIANEMGTTKDALRGLIFRARKTMRSMMGNSSIWFSKK